MNNLSMRYVFDRKHKATETEKGLLQIEVRIIGTSTKKFFSTGVKLTSLQFSDKNGFTCINHPHSQVLTGRGRYVYNRIEAFIFSRECRTFSDVGKWNKKPGETLLVKDFIQAELSRCQASLATVTHYNSLIKRLDGFGKIKTFTDLTYQNIVEFDGYLRQFIVSQPTLYKRHNALKRIIKEAINRKLCDSNPYNLFKVKPGQSKKPVFLNEKEIQQIIDYTPTVDKVKKVKDLFLFQCFTGLAYVDMSKFDKSYIEIVHGYKVINSSRQKTDQEFITLLLPQAEAILDKYEYTLPKISNQKYNDYIKLLAVGAGIDKRLTSHAARHTFATYLLNKGIPIETVAKAMGHSNIRMTQHYAKLLGKKVVDDMSRLLL